MRKVPKPRRAGDARVSFFAHGMPRDIKRAEAFQRKTRAEQLAELAAIQKARPLKPPPRDFGERRSRAGEREAARYNAKQVPPEIDYPGMPKPEDK